MPVISHKCLNLKDDDFEGVVIFKTEKGYTNCYCNACKKEFTPTYEEKED